MLLPLLTTRSNSKEKNKKLKKVQNSNKNQEKRRLLTCNTLAPHEPTTTPLRRWALNADRVSAVFDKASKVRFRFPWEQ
jgi:hypothetical protein